MCQRSQSTRSSKRRRRRSGLQLASSRRRARSQASAPSFDSSGKRENGSSRKKARKVHSTNVVCKKTLMSSEVDELREVCAIGAKAIRIMINLARSCGVWRMLAEKYAAQSDRGLFNAALMTVMCAGFVSDAGGAYTCSGWFMVTAAAASTSSPARARASDSAWRPRWHYSLRLCA